MDRKENKGGILTNEELEQDLKAKGRETGSNHPYSGAQDTGERTVRHMGTDVQKADGRPPDEENEEQ
ncbi:MAG: hypothetical protein EOO14_21760 [Chitinophagaceae bacterium]|nr:MAG: hypothetical protein EOO14_21760 [Chitinophagaceae bacterium]